MKGLNFLPVIEAEVIRGIRADTAKGMDAGGSQFVDYTNSYKQYLEHHGYAISPVTLRRKTEDSLLDTLGAQRKDEKHSEISVKSSKEKIAQGLSRKRKFMGVSSLTVLSIEQKLETEFERMLQ
jgi:hypothetical protein